MNWGRSREIGGIAGARLQLGRKGDKTSRERCQNLDGFGLPGEESAGVIARKDAEGLAAKFGGEDHPFTACMNDPDLQKQYPDETQRQQVCGAMKAIVNETGTAKKAERVSKLMSDRIRNGRRRDPFDL